MKSLKQNTEKWIEMHSGKLMIAYVTTNTIAVFFILNWGL